MVEVDKSVVVVAVGCRNASMVAHTVEVPLVVAACVIVLYVLVPLMVVQATFESYATVEDMTGMIALEFDAMLEFQCFVDWLHRVRISPVVPLFLVDCFCKRDSTRNNRLDRRKLKKGFGGF